jgi:hypothetical protein
MARVAEAPRYKLIQPLYIGDEYIPEDEIIETDDDFIPNEGMIPMNEPAKAAFKAFMDKVNGATPDLGEIVEEGYRSRPRHEIQTFVPEDNHKIEMRTTSAKPPITGYDGNTQTMTAKTKAKAKSIGASHEHGSKPAKKVMGTIITETDTTRRGI